MNNFALNWQREERCSWETPVLFADGECWCQPAKGHILWSDYARNQGMLAEGQMDW